MPGLTRSTWTGDYFVRYTVKRCSIGITQKIPEPHKIARLLIKDISPDLDIESAGRYVAQHITGYALGTGIITADEAVAWRNAVMSAVAANMTGQTQVIPLSQGNFEITIRVERTVRKKSTV